MSIQWVVLALALLLLLLSAKLLHIVHTHGHAHTTSRSLLLMRLVHLHAQLVLHSLQVLDVLLIADAATVLLLLLLLLWVTLLHASLGLRLCARLQLLLVLLLEHLLEVRRQAGDDLLGRVAVVLLHYRGQLRLGCLLSCGKLLLSELLLLLLLDSHAVEVLHVVLLWHLLHLLMPLLLLEAWVRVAHLRSLLLHVHTWTAGVAGHLSLGHGILHLAHPALHSQGLFLELGGVFKLPHCVLLLVLTLELLEHLCQLGHLLSELYVLWRHARGISTTKVLTVVHALASVERPLRLDHGHLFRCEVLSHLAIALHHHHVVWRVLRHANVGTTWLHHARCLRHLSARNCLRHRRRIGHLRCVIAAAWCLLTDVPRHGDSSVLHLRGSWTGWAAGASI